MNRHRRVVKRNKRNRIGTLKPKGTETGYSGLNYTIENGQKVLGLKVAPTTSTIIHSMELGKPYVLPNIWVESPQGVTMAQRAEDMIGSECQSVTD